jgi:hypothetical protein
MYTFLSLILTAAPTQLTIEVHPAESIIFVDGKKTGDASKARVLPVKPGKHIVKVVYKGDSHEEEVVVKADEKATWKWTFEDDRKPATEPTNDSSSDVKVAE